MMIRDHFRAHARRRTELRASLKSRDGAAQDVNIRDLGLGGACVELGDAVGAGEGDASGARAEGASAGRASRASIAAAAPSRVALTQPPRPEDDATAAARFEREITVTLEVTTPSLWDPLVVRGKIAWLRRASAGRPTRMGIRFEHRESATVYAIYQLLSAQGH
ncbi:MAG TPA: PilZ domain-containing protein [Byssovorax sp.]|jgi:hypothetical protein